MKDLFPVHDVNVPFMCRHKDDQLKMMWVPYEAATEFTYRYQLLFLLVNTLDLPFILITTYSTGCISCILNI